MAKNYVIGIGGTGARVIEALVHCCAAGFGPKELSLFIVDPDEGNGNLTRTKALVSAYQQCRRETAGLTAAAAPLFGTEISTPEKFVWNIFPEQNETLSHFINHENLRQNHRDLSDFMEVLFSPEELTTQLNEGFRGHPSIGAVVMSNVNHAEQPWRTLWSDVDNTSGEHAVRVFLVGSVFGGTGAAGVPTFGAAQMLKFRKPAALDSTNEKSKILLGSALVLPYFSIDADGATPNAADEMFVTTSDFPIATKAALQYYDEKDLTFDQLYFIGDSQAQRVGKFSVGNRGQENRPHYIELVTALAAFDFLAQREPAGDGPRYFAAAREGETVDWKALPVSRYGGEALTRRQAELKLRLTAMTAFAYAFATYGRDTFRRHRTERIDDPWYRDHFRSRSGDRNRDIGLFEGPVEHVATYCDQFLGWIGALDDGEGRVRLVDRTKLLAGEAGGGRALDYRQHGASIGSFLKGEPGHQRQFHHFQTVLNDVRATDPSMSAASKYVSLFYEAAARFAVANWDMAGSTPS